MERRYRRIRIVVVQPNEAVYFDRYYPDLLQGMDKYLYFCKIAKINYPQDIHYEMNRTDLYMEISSYFPYNEVNERNQSGFVQVSLYLETEEFESNTETEEY